MCQLLANVVSAVSNVAFRVSIVPLGLMGTAQAAVDVISSPFATMEKAAEVFFVSPEGRGLSDGSSSANALPWPGLESFIGKLDHSAKLVFESGNYTMSDTFDLSTASSSNLLVLEGQEDAVIKGVFDFNTLAGSASGFRLRSGNIVIRGFDFENTGVCARVDKYSKVDRVLIENIDARSVHSCIVVDRDVQNEVSNWVIKNSRIDGYYRVGIRLSGMQSHDFLIDNLQIDGENVQGISDCYKTGLQLLSGVSNVHVKNSTIKNNIGQCGEEYQQGDGVEADHKDGTPSSLTFEEVTVSNSGDAELDLKANHVTLSNVVALGGDLTRYAFKVWSYDNYVCTNCYAFGMNKAFINLNQAKMKFVYPTFSNHKPVHICDLRHGDLPEEQSVVDFDNAQIYIGSNEWLSECGTGTLATVKQLPMGRIAPPDPVTDLRVDVSR